MKSDRNPAFNIAHYLPEAAAAFPWKRAVVRPEARDAAGRVAYSHLTFRQLDEACDRYAWGLSSIGISRGMRTLLMVRPGLDFYAITFALFKIGAVPVFIDPGMGWGQFMRCVSRTAPEAFIGVPAAHVLRLFFPGSFRTVKIRVTLGRRRLPGVCCIHRLPNKGAGFPVAAVERDETAAVLFTTGSTGPAKGVFYTHRIFVEQTETLRREYRITPDDVDLPCFPLFGLFSTALGATAVIPDMDPSRPAHVDPERIVAAIKDHGVTYSFGSPTLWDAVSCHCTDHGITLPSLKRVLMAGAPVPGYLHRQLMFQVLAEGARTYTPYGATEALPVTNFTGAEMLAVTDKKTRRGAGMCVGRPMPEIDLRIIGITDDPIEFWSDDLALAQGEIGEIAVKGAVVTRAYDHLPEATHLAKIQDGEGLWHRMGDVGYCDSRGRLWLCGRKGHRVTTSDGVMFTIQCEAIFNEHSRVYRSALVGVGEDRGRQTPAIVIEPERGEFPRGDSDRQAFAQELLALGGESDLTRGIQHVLFHPSFPVDIRHNAKIRREALAEWAQRKLGGKIGNREPAKEQAP